MVGPESFVIEIEKEKVPMLLNEFRNDASSLAAHLKIMNNRMVLLNPRFQQETRQTNDSQLSHRKSADAAPVDESAEHKQPETGPTQPEDSRGEPAGAAGADAQKPEGSSEAPRGDNND